MISLSVGRVTKALLQARSKSVIFPLNSAFRAPFRGKFEKTGAKSH
jgi:hypothetical protein